MSEILERYLTLLADQMQHDAAVLSNSWVVWTVVPFAVYFVLALMKWFILLAPVTLPLSLLTRKLTVQGLMPWAWLKDKKN